ncbi:MAG: zinc-ribbon domain-containing protein [Desulforhopalus sp.]|nr:zinc-ribbon domain-containing protein [Desulforhopalus sp.]
MIVKCPNCPAQLKLDDGIENNLKNLPVGKTIKIQCGNCKETFSLSETVVAGGGQGAFEKDARRKAPQLAVRPPGAPSLDWLTRGVVDEDKNIDGVPRALVLFPDIKEKKELIKSVEDLGYQVEEAVSVEEALSVMYFASYSLVFMHTDYEKGDLENSQFHNYMCSLPMSRRRNIFYVLVGDNCTTMYDLEALTLSVNLTVNSREVKYISILLRKAIPEYEELFGAWMEELRLAGK